MGSFRDGSQIEAFGVGVNIQALAAAPDGSRFAIGGLGSLDVEVWDAGKGKLLQRLEVS